MTKLRGYRDRADAAAVYLRLFYRQRQPEDARGCFVSVHRQRLLYLPLVGGDPRCAQDAEGALAAAENMRSAETGNPTNDGGVRYSIRATQNIDYRTQLEQIENRQRNGSDSLFIGKPSDKLTKAGFSDNPFAMNQSDYRKARRESAKNKHYSSHAVPYEFFEDMPSRVNDASMVIDNGEKATIITDYPMKDKKGNPSYVIAGVLRDHPMESDVVNLVKSAYPFDDMVGIIKTAAESGSLVVVNENKAKDMLATIGVQPSEVSNILSLAKSSLSQSPDHVKRSDRIAPDLFDDDLIHSDNDTDLLTHHLQHHNEAIGEVLRRTADVKLSGTTLSVDPTGDVTITDATAIRRHLAHLSSNPFIGQPIA